MAEACCATLVVGPGRAGWLFEETAPRTPTYNIAEAWWLKGDLNISRLQRALR